MAAAREAAELARYWVELAARLEAAEHRQRGAMVRAAAEANGISVGTTYRRLKTYAGWSSGRQRSGESQISTETLKEIAAVYHEGVRENRKQVMTLALACSIVAQSGREVPISTAQVAKLMRQRRIDQESQAMARHFGQMRSPHPNHTHQIDPSLCLVYYLHGEQHVIRESEFYGNKLDRVAKIQHKCWRYVLTDHASSLIWVRYFAAAGESQALLFEFLTWAWGRCEGRTGHGVPQNLVMDPGSANTGRGVVRLLEALEVTPIVHRPEQPHVKGQVEGAQNIVERHFESRLRFEPVETVEQLNAKALRWAEAYNTNSLPRIDTQLRRSGTKPVARAALWMLIRPQELRELPPREACAALLEGKPIERTVNSRTRISYRHPAATHSQDYDLSSCEGVHRGDKVWVSPLLVPVNGSAHAIRLRWAGLDGIEQTWRLAPIADLDAFGQPLSAPVWGEYKDAPKREAEHRADELARVAYPEQTEGERDAQEARRKARRDRVVPLNGEMNALSHLDQVKTPDYLPRSGEQINAAAPEDQREAVPLVKALLRLSRAWGRPITDAEHDWLAGRYRQAIPADELDRLLAAGTASGTEDQVHGSAEETTRPSLAVVR